jgi:hypothetical protein
MSGKKNEPSATSVERARKKLIALQEGARTMAEVERDAVAVRKNMERLKALRLAKEAEAASAEPEPTPARAKKKARSKS